MLPIIYRAVRAAVLFVSHAVLASIIVLTVFGVDELIRFLGHFSGDHEMTLFGRWPLAYLFQAIDVVMIALFGASGAREAYEELFSSDQEDEHGPDPSPSP